jgi:hypothetical protein
LLPSRTKSVVFETTPAGLVAKTIGPFVKLLVLLAETSQPNGGKIVMLDPRLVPLIETCWFVEGKACRAAKFANDGGVKAMLLCAVA